MVSKGLSVRDAEALSNTDHRPDQAKPEKQRREPNPDLRAVESDLSEKLGMQVAIGFNGKSGTLKIAYRTLDQLDHLTARLGSS